MVVVVVLPIERRVREAQQNNKLGRFMAMGWKRRVEGDRIPARCRIVAAG